MDREFWLAIVNSGCCLVVLCWVRLWAFGDKVPASMLKYVKKMAIWAVIIYLLASVLLRGAAAAETALLLLAGGGLLLTSFCALGLFVPEKPPPDHAVGYKASYLRDKRWTSRWFWISAVVTALSVAALTYQHITGPAHERGRPPHSQVE